MRKHSVKVQSCSLKKALSGFKGANLFPLKGDLYNFLRQIRGVEGVTQIGDLTKNTLFRFKADHIEDVKKYIRDLFESQDGLVFMNFRQCKKLLNLFNQLNDPNFFPEIEKLTDHIKSMSFIFSSQEFSQLLQIYDELQRKSVFFLKGNFDRSFIGAINPGPYLLSLGINNLAADGITVTADLNKRISFQSSQDRFLLDVIFYDDLDADHVNLFKTRIYKAKEKYLKYFCDHLPFESGNEVLDFVNSESATAYGQALERKGFKFDDKRLLAMIKPDGKTICAVNTFLSFLNLKEYLNVGFMGKRIEDDFDLAKQSHHLKQFEENILNLNLLAKFALANVLIEREICEFEKIKDEGLNFFCDANLQAYQNPLSVLIETKCFQQLYEKSIQNICENIVKEMRRIANESQQTESNSKMKRFCAFLNVKYRSLFVKHLIASFKFQKVQNSTQNLRLIEKNDLFEKYRKEYFFLGKLITDDKLKIGDSCKTFLKFDDLLNFEKSKRSKEIKCDLFRSMI